ncbi:MAG: RdgB/HAM1 family non-canonical purine NTP pyrophosphatase [Chloroflexota bacterium]
MQPLLVATTSQHKLEEYRALLAGLPFELRSLADAGIDEDIEETGATFEENARLKAERYRDLSGLLTLADDSGLEVDALNGQPGVHSKRWAGDVSDDDRNVRLLELLADVPEAERTARYRCVIALAEPGCQTLLAEGSCEGRIAHNPVGTNGFGYDPLFFVPELDQTFGQARPKVKNRLSHRGRAVQAGRRLLENRS